MIEKLASVWLMIGSWKICEARHHGSRKGWASRQWETGCEKETENGT